MSFRCSYIGIFENLDALFGRIIDRREGEVTDAVFVCGDFGNHIAVGSDGFDSGLEKSIITLGFLNPDFGHEAITGTGSGITGVRLDFLGSIEFGSRATS